MTDDDVDTTAAEDEATVAQTTPEADADAEDGDEEQEFELVPERTPLTQLFGESARVRLLDVFVATNQTALSASEVAEFGSIDISTVRTSLDVFLENDVIEETGTVGYSPMYALNEDNEVAAAIEELSEALEEMVEVPVAEDDGERWKDSTDDDGDDGDDDGGAWSSR